MQPKQLGPFRIVRVLGRGGMGAVYEGIHDDTLERAAVKVLLAPVEDDGELRQRFEMEIETLKKLRHPNIVRLYGFGEEQFVVYYVMELVDGQSLQQELKKNRVFTWEEVCKIGLEMSHALKHAHDRGIVHRDIKPANILLERFGNVKLSDFGIAHIFGESRLTHVNSVVGTLEFMSPEQSQALAIGPKTDMYALGAVLYTLLVGHPPFQAKTLSELLKKHQNEPPEPICAKNQDVPEMLEAVIMELLRIDPAARPSNTYILGRRLEMILRAYVGNPDLIRPKPSPDFLKSAGKFNPPQSSHSPSSQEQDSWDEEPPSDQKSAQENQSRQQTPISPRENLPTFGKSVSDFLFSNSDHLEETSTHHREIPDEKATRQASQPPKPRSKTFQFDTTGDDFHCEAELTFDPEGRIRSENESPTSSTFRQEEKELSDRHRTARSSGLTKKRAVFRNNEHQDDILKEIFHKNMPHPANKDQGGKEPPNRTPSPQSPLKELEFPGEQDHSLSSILNRQKSMRREFVPQAPQKDSPKESPEKDKKTPPTPDAKNSAVEMTKSQVISREKLKVIRERSASDVLPSTSFSMSKEDALKLRPPGKITDNASHDISSPFPGRSQGSIEIGVQPFSSQRNFPLLGSSGEETPAPPSSMSHSQRRPKGKKTSRFIRVQEDELGELARYREKPQPIISIQTIITSICLILLGGFIYFMIQPVPADVLYARIMKTVGQPDIDEPDNLPKVSVIRRARENIELFITLYSNDPRCDQMKQYIEEIKLDGLQREFDFHINRLEDRSSLPPLERTCLDALALSRTQPEKAVLKFQAILDLYGTEFNVDSFFETDSEEKANELADKPEVENGKPSEDSAEKEKEKFAPRRPRSESRNDLCLELIRRRMRTISSQSQISIQEQMKLLQNRLDKAEELKWTNPEATQAICSGIIELYQDRTWADPYLQRAREIQGATENHEPEIEHDSRETQ